MDQQPTADQKARGGLGCPVSVPSRLASTRRPFEECYSRVRILDASRYVMLCINAAI